LGINLLDLHIQCFSSWEKVKNILKYKEMKIFATKLIVFAPNTIPISKIKIINKMKYVHDKSPPIEPIQKYHPICTILYKDKNFADSFFNTLKIADDIFQLVR
jgi:predicted ATP-grasp superfamily ATP-dependent carboligase